MPKPTTFVRRGILVQMLCRRGFTKFDVEKWLREGTLPAHVFPGLPKKAGQRAYFALATVEQILGIELIAGQLPADSKTTD